MAASFEWQSSLPSEHGLEELSLEQMWQELDTRGTKALFVVRHDQVVCEMYSQDWGAAKPHYTASLAKALVGGLSLMLAMDDGLISPDDFACQYVPQWKDDPLKSKITVRHLATHSSGVEDAELSDDDRAKALAEGQTLTDHHMSLPGWKGAFWRKDPDPFTLSRDDAPIIFEPGSRYDYSNPGMAMLSYVVTASMREAVHKDIRTLLRGRIMRPIGIADEEWSIGYGQTYDVDGLPLVANWGGGSFTARAVARIGRLLLHHGEWDGKQIISPAVVQQATSFARTPLPDRPDGNPQPPSGLGWWLNSDRVWGTVPRDAFGGAGAGNQILLVIPSLDMVVVRNGAMLGREADGEGFWGGLENYLFDPLMDSLTRRPPYPRSSVIADVMWEPASQVCRLARGGKRKDGSDNWPMTWADDGNLYTAYGDGYGFEPGVSKKPGLGFGVVIGDADDFVGINIRSDAENTGHGSSGEKASGLLMVENTLYMWARNANRKGMHSRLAWSTDHARTWEWCDWSFEEYGHPTFINYGPNYTGARDGYVYTVSQDHPSAYNAADHFVLMRVPKGQLADRSSYEFFVHCDDSGSPMWTRDVEQRGAVFTNPGYCGRSSITYDAGLHRYLWWQGLRRTEEGLGNREGIDTRFEGGFGVYDAPEPWGPWTTAYFVDKWDVGPGERGCFPTKWMSKDGRTVHLVFSGDDHFAVRKAVLVVTE